MAKPALPSNVDVPPGGDDTILRPTGGVGVSKGKAAPEEGPVQLPNEMILGGQWKIMKKLGEGGCGAVYLVRNTQTAQKAALKAESLAAEGGSVLKIEVDVLSKLKGKKHVCEFLGAGRLEKFQYIVMSLLGESLEGLLKLCGELVTCSTLLRIGIHVLHGLKQIHDCGFVHRDIKPANLALGRMDGGTDPNIVHILDFGLSRAFIKPDTNGKMDIRKPRRSALFRGTCRYCSVQAHLKHDQSRVDDLWSLIYMLAEMRGKLPWEMLSEHKELAECKAKVPDRELFAECPAKLCEFSTYLKSLNYYSKPNYAKMYGFLMDGMTDGGHKFSDPWDWQLKNIKEARKATRDREAAQTMKTGVRPASGPKPSGPKISLKSLTKGNVRTAKSIAEPKTSRGRKGRGGGAASVMGEPSGELVEAEKAEPSGVNPFTKDDFSTDPLGL